MVPGLLLPLLCSASLLTPAHDRTVYRTNGCLHHASFASLQLYIPAMQSPTQSALLSLQEFGNRAGAFPRHPAKLVGAKIMNTFDTEGGPVVFGGRVTEYLFARITGQGLTPL